jgi:penicillin-binding protein 1A
MAEPDHDSNTAADQHSPRESETIAAGRQLIKAAGRDLRALARRLAPRPRPRPEGWLRGVGWTVVKGVSLVSVLGMLVFGGTMLWVLRDMPVDPGSAAPQEREIMLEAADGKPLGRVGPVKVSNASRADFPPLLVNAVLSIEDRRFYHHWGVDVLGILRAARRNYASGRIVEGGSSITQQLVKLQLLGNERTFGRKVREAFAAIWLELRLSKDEILTRYLNSVYMGAGAQGIPAGAHVYFNKRPSELTLSEAALLAGLIKAPTKFNPRQNPQGAQARAEVVIEAMVDAGYIDRKTADEAKTHTAILSPPPVEAGTWFSDWVAQEAQDVTGTFKGSMRVRTTLDSRMQGIAERVVGEALAEAADKNVSQAALVAMRPDGAVVAMVGGRDYKASQFNRAVQAQRQPGSAFKLFVYLAALRSGLRPDDVIDASPLTVNGWQPDNYGAGHYGSMTMADAFARSVNTAAVRLALNTGLDQVITAARDLGISTPLPKVPSLALGAADTSLLKLTAAYASVLAGRAPVQPWGVASFASPARPRLVSIGAPVGGQKPLGDIREPLIGLLEQPVERGTARAAATGGFAAGKTGTTQDHRDAWFIGFNESLVVGVWVGNDDRSPMDEVTGGSLPAQMWKSFVTQAAPPSGEAQPDPEMPVVQMPEAKPLPEDQPAVANAGSALCDYRACSAKYQSFDASDCTYQPYGGGQRQRCEKGAPQTQSPGTLPVATQPVATQPPATQPVAKPAAQKPAGQAVAGAKCDVGACSASYSSFRASDCTYQPFDGGPRRTCDKAGAAAKGSGAPERPRRSDYSSQSAGAAPEAVQPDGSAEGPSAGDGGFDLPFLAPDEGPIE